MHRIATELDTVEAQSTTRRRCSNSSASRPRRRAAPATARKRASPPSIRSCCCVSARRALTRRAETTEEAGRMRERSDPGPRAGSAGAPRRSARDARDRAGRLRDERGGAQPVRAGPALDARARCDPQSNSRSTCSRREAGRRACASATASAPDRALGERRADAELRRNDQLERASFLEQSLIEGAERRAQLEGEVESARAELAAGEPPSRRPTTASRRREAALSQLKAAGRGGGFAPARTLLELKKNCPASPRGVKGCSRPRSRPGMLGVVANVLEVPSGTSTRSKRRSARRRRSCWSRIAPRSSPALGRLRSLESGRATLVDLSALTSSPRIDAPQHAGVARPRVGPREVRRALPSVGGPPARHVFVVEVARSRRGTGAPVHGRHAVRVARR